MSQPSELIALRLWKEDAIERMEENERVLLAQRERIEVLEFHLGKCRDSAYQMCYATVGVLPADYGQETEPKKRKKKVAA